MNDWQLFENNACKFLSKTINIEGIKFQQSGKSNSWESDIYVKCQSKDLFLIESKLSPCQSGQFVILLKDGKYEYSKLNHFQMDDVSKSIIIHINENILDFQDCGTAGREIILSKNILADWIKKHYSSKNARFFIISDKPLNFSKNFIKIIPFEDFENNFQISAVLRRKRSGTQLMPFNDFHIVEEKLKERFGSNCSLDEDGFIKLNDKIDNPYLGDEYYLSQRKGCIYQIRKRSNTNSPSVIFSLKYIGEKKTAGFDLLETEIKKLI